jgi:uncharacterized protein DUF5996
MNDLPSPVWPALPYEEWRDTYATLHMWTQVVGKIALAASPSLNHSWAIALHLTARGLETGILQHAGRSFTIEFDFVHHRLLIATADGEQRTIPLAARTVAEFHREVMAALGDLGLTVKIWTMPVEVPSPIRFEDDVVHRSYDPVYANRFWRILLQVSRVFTSSRCRFLGKASPVNFFWGAFDLALTRFSGRVAPPREGPAFMREAYSHEVISHGFWPGSGPVLEPAFYAYAVPEPTGFKDALVQPDAANYNTDLGEFILPYEAVRQAASPDDALLSFVESTFAAGATLGGWDRSALERATVRQTSG